MNSKLVEGPVWSSGTDGIYPGRYPLSVERHVLARVGELMPGITTVTQNARYYTLHSYVSVESVERELSGSESNAFLRRCESIMGAISVLHADQHTWLPRPHGAGYLDDKVADGFDVDKHSSPGGYAGGSGGYRGQYQAPEVQLGLLRSDNGRLLPGPTANIQALRSGFSGLRDLAAKSTITRESLMEHKHLCICGSRSEADGAFLRDLLLASRAEKGTATDKRRQTVQMMLQLAQITPARSITEELSDTLNFSPLVADNPVLENLEVTEAWQGVTLRSRSVGAWRALWAGLVSRIPGLCHRSRFAEPLADDLPKVTVRQFQDSLPKVWSANGSALPAELDDAVQSMNTLARQLALLVIGASRVKGLPDHVRPYFESERDSFQELSPTWMATMLEEWSGRSLQDFARAIGETMLRRANRLSIKKARFDYHTSTFKIPTRIFFRDDMIFRRSNEGGRNVSLRWDPLVHVLSGVGLLVRDDNDAWQITSSGLAALNG